MFRDPIHLCRFCFSASGWPERPREKHTHSDRRRGTPYQAVQTMQTVRTTRTTSTIHATCAPHHIDHTTLYVTVPHNTTQYFPHFPYMPCQIRAHNTRPHQTTPDHTRQMAPDKTRQFKKRPEQDKVKRQECLQTYMHPYRQTATRRQCAPTHRHREIQADADMHTYVCTCRSTYESLHDMTLL